ncbi:MAG: hypothetical protein ABWY16_09410 [Pedobacter sp.]|uniref:hypothetical protein n=1 Tax=Pedobacter sp. TaxID=1411316 RepID=UPI0033918946
MISNKANLLQRVRVITIALVTIVGFGTIAMKPTQASFQHQYGVAETADGSQWEIQADVTDPTSSYICNDGFNTACEIGSNLNLSPGDLIPKDESQTLQKGRFEPL